MNEPDWDAHFRSLATPGRDPSEPVRKEPDASVKEIVERHATVRSPRRALDLACGAGGNALWLAEQGWDVMGVDRSLAAIELVRTGAARRGLSVATRVADLEAHGFTVEPGAWDLIVMCRYLQVDLFEPARVGLAPGGLLIVIALLADPASGAPQRFRVRSGELASYFRGKPGWRIVLEREVADAPEDFSRRHAVAEIAVQRDPDS